MATREKHRQEVDGWEEGTCSDCGCPFPCRQEYERQCPICYKTARDYKLLWGDQAFLWAQEALQETRLALRDAQKELLDLRRKGKAPDVPKGLRGDLLRRVIALCHPDLHKNSKKATHVTQELLLLRRKRGRRKP